jgi:hypothetical protein
MKPVFIEQEPVITHKSIYFSILAHFGHHGNAENKHEIIVLRSVAYHYAGDSVLYSSKHFHKNQSQRLLSIQNDA